MKQLSLAFVLALSACGTRCPPPQSPMLSSDDTARAPIDRTLDAWHAAAAASDLEGYFGLMTPDAIFLGTDATERWDIAQFRVYAARPFAEGHGWRMRSVRREVIVRGDVAWFDEDLDAVNLGPARGSGVLLQQPDGRWLIAHYNLAMTVPNEDFASVRDLLGRAAEARER